MTKKMNGSQDEIMYNNMIGKLHKKEDRWVVRYKIEDDLFSTDGGELSLHPDTPIEIFAELNEYWKKNLQDREVEFVIVPFIPVTFDVSMSDTFVAKIIVNDDDNYPEPNESLKSAKENYDKLFHKSRSIGPSNVDEWDPEYMDGKNEDTWFDELDINPQWKRNLKKYNLSPEVWNVICGLYQGETLSLKKSMDEQRFWIEKYHNLKKSMKNLLD